MMCTFTNTILFYTEYLQLVTQTWGCGCSEAHAVAWHMFDLIDDTNMLIDKGIMEYP